MGCPLWLYYNVWVRDAVRSNERMNEWTLQLGAIVRSTSHCEIPETKNDRCFSCICLTHSAPFITLTLLYVVHRKNCSRNHYRLLTG